MEYDWLDSRIVDETIELVLVFNEKGEILFGNKSAREKLEYSEEELTGCAMPQIFRQEFRRTDDGEPVFDIKDFVNKKETAMYRRNSSCFTVSIRFFLIEEKGLYYLMAEDITGRKDADVRIRELLEEGENNRRMRNEFTANVTHELRTPVNGIRGHVTTLLNTLENEEQRKTLEVVLYCCDNMTAIINDILDFSKLEAGKFVIEEQEFDFFKMVDKIITTHITEINRKELHLSVDIDENIPRFVIGDEIRIGQVLNNLLSNAVKFTSVGQVSVSVSKTMQMSDEIELFFMVKDSGIGISRKEQDSLFQSFSQVDASITRRFGGTGLGLAISKQLVEMMRGNIHVESEKGKGSTFSFFIKLRTSQNMSENGKSVEVYKKWNNFAAEEEESGEEIFQFGGPDNRRELKKRMDKIVLSIELGTWDKAETLASTVKALVDKGDDELKRQVLRMEMAIRKAKYDKSMEMYDKVKAMLVERIGEL